MCWSDQSPNKGKAVVKEHKVKTLQDDIMSNSVIWKWNVDTEQEDIGKIDEVRENNAQKDSWGKKTEDGYVRGTNEEVYNIHREQKIDNVIRARRLQWLGHLEWMEGDRAVKKIYCWIA